MKPPQHDHAPLSRTQPFSCAAYGAREARADHHEVVSLSYLH